MNTVVKDTTPAWIGHIEKLINKALSMDEETLVSLEKIDNRIIGFEFINTTLTLFLFPSSKGLAIQTEIDNKPDVLIKGTPSNFIMMIASSRQETVSLPADMQVIGDIGLAQQFQGIMQNIDIDLEEPLSNWVGDSMAYQIGKFVRGAHRFTLNTGKILATDISEYLRFEINLLPDDLLVNEFSQDVDVLREDVERFEQRLNKLQKKLKGSR
ncbi:MAG: SCP2 sterol-binding domain-containing protein [Pseudomonadota bacterium]